MKRILIAGANSYIGTSFAAYAAAHYADYQVDTIDMVDGSWKKKSFRGYDCVYHVAGIAHADTGNITAEKKAFYYRVNRDLTIETAKKAKAEGVGQFIFMSSIIVYGDSAAIGKTKFITASTPPTPTNFYGNSKLMAEEGILPLNDDSFRVVVLRPPMVYGPGSKGNYPILAKLARTVPVFPRVNNQRSMLYVENLCEFVCLMIKNREQGIFFPQNNQYSNTSQLVKLISQAHGRKITIIDGCTWALKGMSHVTGLINKAFGSACYDMALSEYKENYRVCDLEESIERTELQNGESTVSGES